MNDIMLPVVFLTATGGILGLILALVAKFMEVPVDELAESILNILPKVNCGACGYPGCGEYAASLASGKEENVNLCTPGKKPVAEKIRAILDDKQ